MGGQQAKSRKLDEARKEITTTTKSEIEILSSLRNGEKEYDF
jgi:hypothetical protein